MAKVLMVVGSLNREVSYFQGARGPGLSIYRFDTDDGTSTLLCEEGSVDNPTFLAADDRTGCVYAVSEVSGWHEGTVTAYRFDPEAGRLRYLNKQATLGSTAAHCAFAPDRRHLLVVNYGMGAVDEGPDRALVSYRIEPDGSLSAPIASVSHKGQGPHLDRQERSHPHCVVQSPDGVFLVVTDLGLDTVSTYRYGPEGQLPERPEQILRIKPGAGPRHIAFHPNGRFAVLTGELDSTLVSLRYAPETGAFSVVSTLPTIPEGAPENHASDLQIHPGGRFVFGANRGHDSIVVAAIDGDTGELSLLGRTPCGGRTPRNLAIDPTGSFLIAANQNGDNLSVFAIDRQTGALTPTGTDIALGSPMCVKFMPAL